MSCFRPKQVFINKKGYEKGSQAVTVPCQKCIGCYFDYSNEWVLRCKMELEQCEKATFITLTYDNEHLPDKSNLKRKDVQDFLKRLRRKIEPLKIRFFGCGEYGSKGSRPHYHLIIFGYQFEDLIFLKRTKRGENIYRSPFLEKIWTFGFSSVGYVNEETIKYCTKYLQKFAFNLNQFEVKPFTMCSTRVPLGYDALSLKQIESDAIWYHGHKKKLPRSFLRRIENNGLFNIDIIKDKREERRLFFEKYQKRSFEENKNLEKKLLKSIDFFSRL